MSGGDLGKALGGQDAPKTAQDGTKTGQDGARTAQDGAKTGQVGAETPQNAAKTSQDRAKTGQEPQNTKSMKNLRKNNVLWEAQDVSGELLGTSWGFLVAPWRDLEIS